MIGEGPGPGEHHDNVEAEKCLDSGMVQRKEFYCRYEGENFQRHREEFRAERESSGLNVDTGWAWQ